MTSALPEWYPLANATDEQIDAWLMAADPPYQEMRTALPWLDEKYQFDAWINGVREARSRMTDAGCGAISRVFADIPLPPRRVAGRAKV